MSMISTHVLNLAIGFPARNLSVVLESQGPLRAWRKMQNTASFYPEITITFGIQDPTQRHHVPLLIGPFGDTTYRGS